ncbi:hypothetical protein MPSEU_000525300 [Mayamaea pseudoterrestris]|nr:hypothetical protein MPSEU_000525300 [Mayamaea pseudoterrestris]
MRSSFPASVQKYFCCLAGQRAACYTFGHGCHDHVMLGAPRREFQPLHVGNLRLQITREETLDRKQTAESRFPIMPHADLASIRSINRSCSFLMELRHPRI